MHKQLKQNQHHMNKNTYNKHNTNTNIQILKTNWEMQTTTRNINSKEFKMKQTTN